MHLTQEEERDSWRWFVGAGIFAIILSIVLYNIDVRMSSSTSEAELGKKLRELRGAQASLADRSVDERIKQALPK